MTILDCCDERDCPNEQCGGDRGRLCTRRKLLSHYIPPGSISNILPDYAKRLEAIGVQKGAEKRELEFQEEQRRKIEEKEKETRLRSEVEARFYQDQVEKASRDRIANIEAEAKARAAEAERGGENGRTRGVPRSIRVEGPHETVSHHGSRRHGQKRSQGGTFRDSGIGGSRGTSFVEMAETGKERWRADGFAESGEEVENDHLKWTREERRARTDYHDSYANE